MYQFKAFLTSKGLNATEILANPSQVKIYGGQYLREAYPGAAKPPSDLIKVITSDDPAKTLTTQALLNPEDRKSDSCATSK